MSAKSPGVVSSAGTLFSLRMVSSEEVLLRHFRALRDDMYLLIKAGPSRVAGGRLFSALTTPGERTVAGGALRQGRLTISNNRLPTPEKASGRRLRVFCKGSKTPPEQI